MKEKERLLWLDWARGASICLVVMLHADIALSAVDLNRWAFTLGNAVAAPVRMATFFTVSGMLAAGTLSRRWGTLVETRFFPFAALFVIWSLVLMTERTALGVSSPAPVDWIAFLWQPDSILWFIWASILYLAIGRAIPVRGRGVALAVAAASAVAATAGLVPGTGMAQEKAPIYLPFFLAGLYHGDAIRRLVAGAPLVTGLVAAAGFVGLSALSFAGVPGSWALYVPRAICAVLMLLPLAILAVRLPLIGAVGLYLGRRTLEIYVAHMLVLLPLSMALGALVVPGPVAQTLTVPAASVAAVAGALLLARVLRGLGAGWIYRPRLPRPDRGTAGLATRPD